MGNWIAATDGEENEDGYVNLGQIRWVYVTGNDTNGWKAIAADPVNTSETYVLALTGSPFATQADAMAAVAAATAVPVPPAASFSGTVTY